MALLEEVRERERDALGVPEKLPVPLWEGLVVHEKLGERLPVMLAVAVWLDEREVVPLQVHEIEPVEETVSVPLVVTLLVVEKLSERLLVMLREVLPLRVAEPDVLRVKDWVAVRLQDGDALWLPVVLPVVD